MGDAANGRQGRAAGPKADARVHARVGYRGLG